MTQRTKTIKTKITEKLGIKCPIILAGMSGVSHGELAAAVSNAGGLGVIGGLTLTPKVLKKEIDDLKSHLVDKNLPFGVDLAIPQIGGNARKTNHDYTHGKLPELIDLIIAEKAALFVCAVGVPPSWVVDKLHGAGIPIMNMVGAPKHVDKAIEAGCDYICAQGTEAGGHTGEIGTMALIPQCVERCKGKTSKLTGDPIMVVGAGGIVTGQGIAAALSLGAQAVWIGTRFVASEESHASDRHKQTICDSGALNTTTTLIYSGRPLRVFASPYVKQWHSERREDIEKLCANGVVPYVHDIKTHRDSEKHFDIGNTFPMLFGQGCGMIKKVQPAGEIVDDLMTEAIATLEHGPSFIARL